MKRQPFSTCCCYSWLVLKSSARNIWFTLCSPIFPVRFRWRRALAQIKELGGNETLTRIIGTLSQLYQAEPQPWGERKLSWRIYLVHIPLKSSLDWLFEWIRQARNCIIWRLLAVRPDAGIVCVLTHVQVLCIVFSFLFIFFYFFLWSMYMCYSSPLLLNCK